MLKEITEYGEKKSAVREQTALIPEMANYHDCMFEMSHEGWSQYRIFRDKNSGFFAGLSPEGNFNVYVAGTLGLPHAGHIGQLIEQNAGKPPAFYRGNFSAVSLLTQNAFLRSCVSLIQPIDNYTHSIEKPVLHSGSFGVEKATNSQSHIALIEEWFDLYNSEAGTSYKVKNVEDSGVYGLYLMTDRVGKFVGGYSIELRSQQWTWLNRFFIRQEFRGSAAAGDLWPHYQDVCAKAGKASALQFSRSNTAARKFYLKKRCLFVGSTFYAKFIND